MACAIAGLACVAAPLHAVDSTWNGSVSTDWATNGNWDGSLPPQTGDTVLFSASASRHTLDLAGATVNGIDTIRFAPAGLGTFTLQNGTLGLQGNNLVEVLSIVPTPQNVNMNLTLSGAGAFRNNSTATTLTIGGNVTLNGQFTVDGSGTTHVSGNIGGLGFLVKNNSGLLILSGNASFTTVTVSAGTLQIGNGGTGGAIASNINNNAAVVFNRSDISANVSTIFGTGSVTKSGAGTLTLSSSNLYTGATVVNGGILNISSLADAGSASSIGAASTAASNLVLDGGTLRNNASTGQATNRLFTLGPGGATLDAGASRLAFDGTGAVAMMGSGNRTLTLTGSNSAENSDVDLNLADPASGTLSVVKSGVTGWALIGAHTYSGPTTVQAGRLLLFGASGSSNSAYSVASGARVELAPDSGTSTLGSLEGAGTVAGGVFTGTATAAIGSLGTSTTFSGTLEDLQAGFNLRLNKVGAGTLTLTGTNTYTGGTTISSGALSIGNGGTTGTIVGNISNNSILIFHRSDNVTFGGAVSGSGSLNKLGAGTLTLTVTNHTYTGGTAIHSGTVEVAQLANAGSPSGIGAAPASANNLFLDGGTLRFTGAPGAGATDRLFTMTPAGATLDASGTGLLLFSNTGSIDLPTLHFPRTLTLTGAGIGELLPSLANSGLAPTHLTKSGTGGWILSNAANSFSGNVNVQAGALAVVSGAAGNNAAYTIDSGALLTVIGPGISLGSLAGAGGISGQDSGAHAVTVGGSNASTTFSGSISNGTGVVSLTKIGTGTLILTGANTYSGNTTISGGTLQVGNGGATGSIGGNVVNDAALAVNLSTDLTLSGVVSGTGSLTKAGAGKLTVSNTNTYTGATTVSSGTLLVTGALGSTPVSVNNSATVSGSGTINGSVVVNSLGVLAPGNSVGKLTAGNTQLNIASFYQFEYKSSAAAPVAGVDNDLLQGLAGTSLNLNFSGANPANITVVAVPTGTPSSSPVAYTIAQFDTITGAPAGDVTSRFIITGDFGSTPTVTLVDGTTFDSLVLTFTPVPEPSGAIFGALTVGMLTLRRRRRVSPL